jgi:predicted amidohydrolase
MKIGVFQFTPARGRPEANGATLESALRGADVDLLVAPELATSGYLYFDRAELASVAESVPEGPTTQRLLRACRETGRSIVFGLPERAGDRIYNAAVLVTPEGAAATYRKAHLFDTETLVFDRSEASQGIARAAGATIGLMICFDWRFPEVARLLALRGAEVLAHPSNLVLPYCQDAMVTRSLENRVFTVTANRTGTETVNGTTIGFTGRSQIVSPSGERLVSMGVSEEGVRIAAVDPSEARDKRATARNDLFADRRTDLWADLLAAPRATRGTRE